MTENQKTYFALRIEHLQETIWTWNKNFKDGSTDLLYPSYCTAHILEAEAELKGITFALGILGYKAKFADGHVVIEKNN